MSSARGSFRNAVALVASALALVAELRDVKIAFRFAEHEVVANVSQP